MAFMQTWDLFTKQSVVKEGDLIAVYDAIDYIDILKAETSNRKK